MWCYNYHDYIPVYKPYKCSPSGYGVWETSMHFLMYLHYATQGIIQGTNIIIQDLDSVCGVN